MENQPISLQEWQEMFANIYNEKNRRDYGAYDLLLHIAEEMAGIDECLRTEDFTPLARTIAACFAWLFAFCTHLNIFLEETLFAKYSGRCPYCGARENCICVVESIKPAESISNFQNTPPSCLDEWQSMFLHIYGKVNKVAGTAKVWLHVHEEFGEVSRELRMRQRESLISEVADLFAWLIAFCNLTNIKISEVIWNNYPGQCDVCKKPRCQCPKV